MTSPDDGKPARGLRDLDDIDAVFDALGHAARRHILQVLAARDGSLNAGELAARFSHSWPTTTRHLGVLVEAGLVSVSAAGRERRYRLERQRLGDVLALWLGSVGFELLPSSNGRNGRGARDTREAREARDARDHRGEERE